VSVSLSEALYAAINDYEIKSEMLPGQQERWATICRTYINMAYTNGVVLENKEKYQARIEDLQKQVERLEGEKASLLAQIDEFEREQGSSNDRINTLQRDIVDVTDENRRLNEELNWYKREFGDVYNKNGVNNEH
jgi:septal ring factor EnvC (AmiA/AmiB activator)